MERRNIRPHAMPGDGGSAVRNITNQRLMGCAWLVWTRGTLRFWTYLSTTLRQPPSMGRSANGLGFGAFLGNLGGIPEFAKRISIGGFAGTDFVRRRRASGASPTLVLADGRRRSFSKHHQPKTGPLAAARDNRGVMLVEVRRRHCQRRGVRAAGRPCRAVTLRRAISDLSASACIPSRPSRHTLMANPGVDTGLVQRQR